jgi:hypothetical protein
MPHKKLSPEEFKAKEDEGYADWQERVNFPDRWRGERAPMTQTEYASMSKEDREKDDRDRAVWREHAASPVPEVRYEAILEGLRRGWGFPSPGPDNYRETPEFAAWEERFACDDDNVSMNAESEAALRGWIFPNHSRPSLGVPSLHEVDAARRIWARTRKSLNKPEPQDPGKT